MRQYMALMQQAMGMPGMNGSSSRQQNFFEKKKAKPNPAQLFQGLWAEHGLRQ